MTRALGPRLGERFHLPSFHDTILVGGTVSLPVLQRTVETWIEQSLSSPQ